MNRIINLKGFSFSPRQRSRRGMAALEFALSLPIWITLLLGATDGTMMMIEAQRVDRISYSVTDIVTQSQTLKITDLDSIVLAAGQLMQPFTFGQNGVVIVTSLYKPAGLATQITWQYIGGGTLARGSKIGSCTGISTNCTAPQMPDGLTLADNENVIVSEVYYAYTPLFINAGFLAAGDVYRTAIYKPRLSPLITPPT
jgi:hypothetical protein